jgi:hypothetical protein
MNLYNSATLEFSCFSSDSSLASFIGLLSTNLFIVSLSFAILASK